MLIGSNFNFALAQELLDLSVDSMSAEKDPNVAKDKMTKDVVEKTTYKYIKELIGDVLRPFNEGMAAHLDSLKMKKIVRKDLDTICFAEIFTSTLMGGLLRRSSGLSGMDREAWLENTVAFLVHGAAGAVKRG